MSLKDKLKYYSTYEFEDFVRDEYFIDSVRTDDAAAKTFFRELENVYPEKSLPLMQARDFLEMTRVQDDEPTTGKIKEMWEGILSRIDTPAKRPALIGASVKRWLSAAAAVVVMVGLSVFLFQNSREHQIALKAGEFRTIQLSDGTTVNLSPGSKLRYASKFRKSDDREVWLDGEAFFSVTREPNEAGGRPFIVHTKDLDVVVLGTTFNVNTKHSSTKVVLRSGKVNVQFKGEKPERIELKPSEMLTYSEQADEIRVDSVNTLSYISWKDQQFIFQETPVREIAEKIEEYYGYKVEIEDEELERRKITGTLTVSNANKLIDILSILLHIDVEKKGDTLYFRNYL